MIKRFSLFAFPAACLALMVGMAACAGSDGSSTAPHVPTVAETVDAVRNAQTPAQGEFAFNQVLANTGQSSSPVFKDYTDEEEAAIREFFAAAISSENNEPNDVTYADAIADDNEDFGTTADPAMVIDQLNTDLAAVESDPSTPARSELLLLIGLEGGGAALTKHITPVGAYLVATWFAERFAPEELPLVRSACTTACRVTFNRTVVLINRATTAFKAAARTARRKRLISQQQYVALVNAANRLRAARLIQARAAYQACFAGCHGQ